MRRGEWAESSGWGALPLSFNVSRAKPTEAPRGSIQGGRCGRGRCERDRFKGAKRKAPMRMGRSKWADLSRPSRGVDPRGAEWEGPIQVG